MHSPRRALALLAVAASIGCGPRAAKIDPAELPRRLIRFEELTDEIIGCFDRGEPLAADHAMHKLGKVYASLSKVSEAISEPTSHTRLVDAMTRHAKALGVIHTPMHTGEFPDDFDFEPVRGELLASLDEVLAAVPEPVAEAVRSAAAERRNLAPEADSQPGNEPAATGDPTPETEARHPPPDLGASLAGRAPLCPSVMLWDEASCRLAPERVNRVAGWLADAAPDARWVQLVPTLHATNARGRITAYGHLIDRAGSWESPDNFKAATDGSADRLRDTVAAALRQAVRRGLNVAILPHLDPAVLREDSIEWRNDYRFDPTETLGVGSYESLLIEPLAEAIEAEADATTRIDLALSGEMGRSLFEHPRQYRRLLLRLRERFASQPRTAGVRLGISLNWNDLAGNTNTDALDRDAIAMLCARLDFVGFSCYAPVGTPPSANDFARAAKGFLDQVHQLGGGFAPSTRLVISEVGLGGGHPVAGKDGIEFPTPADLAARPHEGSGQPNSNPWEDADLRRLRQQFHTALLTYLASEPTPAIDKAFLWSEGPWDPQGVATERFSDKQIQQAIAAHNARPRVSL